MQGNRSVPGILHILANSKLSIGKHTLKLKGSISGTGTIKGSSKSDLIINGSGLFGTLYFDESTDSKTNVLNNLTINRTSSGQVTIANKLNLTGTYTPTAGVLTTNDTIVFKSYSTQTAIVTKGSQNGGYFSGIAQVERFIPARRAWRFLTAPVINDTLHIRTAWQEGVNNKDLNYANNLNPYPGFGTHITGDNDVSKGFDFNTTTSPSLRTWQQSNSDWSIIAPATKSILINNFPAYFLFVRGSRNINLAQGTQATPDSTRLRVTGFLNMGSIAKILAGNSNDIVFVGNPYVSPIDLSRVLDSASNISGGIKFWIWDPKLNSVGGYVAYDNGSMTASDSYTNTDEAKILQSGGAFLVQISHPSASVTFHESDKVSTEFNVFGKTILKPEVHADIIKLSADSAILEDGTTAQFNSKYSAAVDDFDAVKLLNFGDNIALVRNNSTLAIELRPVPQSNDTLFVRLNHISTGPYKLRIYSHKLPVSMNKAWLVDTYLNTKTKLNLDDTLYYDFTPTTADTNRFMIVFAPSSLKTTSEDYIVNKNGSNKSNIRLYPNPIITNKIKLQFENMNAGVYDVFVYNEKRSTTFRKKN